MLRQAMVNFPDAPIQNPADFSTIAVFFWQLGGCVKRSRRRPNDNANLAPKATSVAVGQHIALSTFINDVPCNIPNEAAVTIIAAGLTNLLESVSSSEDLAALLSIWNTTITRIMLFSLAMVCMAVHFTLEMEWLHAQKIATERKEESTNLMMEDI